MIKIPKSIHQHLIEHAKREAPLECCGILAGRNGRVEKIFELPNAEKSPTRYSMAPQDQLRVFEEMDREGLEMLAVYHSHPHTDPYPSKTDIQLFFYPEVGTVIISLRREPSEVRAFRIKEGEVFPEEIEVLS